MPCTEMVLAAVVRERLSMGAMTLKNSVHEGDGNIGL